MLICLEEKSKFVKLNSVHIYSIGPSNSKVSSYHNMKSLVILTTH